MKIDLNNLNHQMIIAALAGMIKDDRNTPHEAFEILEDIKRQTFHSLAEIYREGRTI